MSASICPKCGNVLKGDRPRFCEQCGCDLSSMPEQQIDAADIPSPLDVETSSEESVGGGEGSVYQGESNSSMSADRKEEIFLEGLKKASVNGKLSMDDIQRLSSLREELGIDTSRAKQLWEKAVESLRPVQRDDFDEKSKGSSRGIVLSINTNRFYMEGFEGVLHIKLENLSDNTFDSVRVVASGSLLGRSEPWSCRLEPCYMLEKRFSVKPTDPGAQIVQFSVSAKQGKSIYAFWAETDLPVLTKTKKLQNISMQVGKLVDFGNVAENAKQMAHSYKVNIDNLIKQDKIRDANDLMMEYRKLPSEFKMLQLTFDPEFSEQLETARDSGKGKRIAEAGRGSLTDGASLRVQSKDMPLNIVLVAKPEVSFGKHRENDIVTRILPRSPGNDHLSNKISRIHCSVELTEEGVLVKDNESANGTLLDGKQVDADGRKLKYRARQLAVGDILKMTVKCLLRKHGPGDAAYEGVFGKPVEPMWETAAQTSLDSITLERKNNLGPHDERGCEKYCLIYRIATIGSGADCSISLSGKSLEPQHAGIVYYGRMFYLENLCDLTDVYVNGEMLSKGELIPLSFGDRIRIARLDIEFTQKSQLYIDSPGKP